MNETFKVGEVAIYWKPGVIGHGKEITILSELYLLEFRNYILDNSRQKAQPAGDRPVFSRPYFLGFAAFLFALGLCGCGGVLSMRRSTSSSAGFFVAMVGG